VKLVSGEVETGRNRHISDAEYAEGKRLACVSRVVADAEIYVPPSAEAYKNRIRVDNDPSDGTREYKAVMESRGFALNALLADIHITVAGPTLDDPMADSERLLSALAGESILDGKPIAISLTARRKLPSAMRESHYDFHALVHTGNDSHEPAQNQGAANAPAAATILSVSAEPITPLGLAVDIGTTSVSALLVDLTSGAILAKANAGNAQIRYGADVIHRIIESAKPGGLERLRRAITDECLLPLIAELCAAAETDPECIVRAAFTGNTTMIHFLAGVYADYLRMEPYVPAFFALDGLRGSDLPLGIHPDAEILIAPSVGSYVGGDITAGAFASGIAESDELSLFIDLGTNGEIVLGSSDYLMTCACSAGPAFEGGDIACGMRATDGAIEKCTIDEKTMEPVVRVIGAENQKPLGICGSGLIDIVAELFRTGIINAKGKFVRENERIKTDEWGITSYVIARPEKTAHGAAIYIDDADIDNFIRAKGSVFSAVRTLLEMVGAEPADIGRILIAGGIGSGIDIESAVAVGMLPDIPRERYRYIGNSSLTGAYAMLASREAAEAVGAVAASMTYIELSAYPGYMDEFVAACFLPHTDASLFGGA
jgi:uncharacterized 2Fe-2S/4Fe-4S cluster protein (DUF4445 family)